MRLQLGLEAIRNYRRLNYKPWYALAEFVDNSTQSYFNHQQALDEAFVAEDDHLWVSIVYDRDAGWLRISDNAMGMTYKELEEALIIGRPPANSSGRSQFGMGLKTAATWFGDDWKIRTKKLGETIEYEASVNVEAIASGQAELPVKETPKDAALHYTVIEISSLNVKLQTKTLGKIKDFLRSMFRVDLRTGTLQLSWQNSPLVWEDDLNFLKAHDGREYKGEFNFEVAGKPVSGWIGVLGPGSSGRPNAGLTIIRRGRVIRGWPEAWRPEEIFGQVGGSNNLINQRIAGEIHLDDFAVSHTKDDIQWHEDEEDQVQQLLKEFATDFLAVAATPRISSSDDQRGPSEAEVQVAVDELRVEMQSQEFIDLIEIDTVPPPEVLAESNRPMIEAVGGEEPNFKVAVGEEFFCSIYLTMDTSPHDPYYTSDAMGGAQAISVVVNRRHPQWGQLGGSESVAAYLRHCVYDAIAEWQCRRSHAELRPDTIKALKDRLLRLPATMEANAGNH